MLSNSTQTQFLYDEEGKLKESISVMMFANSLDTTRIDQYYFDKTERKIRLERTSNGKMEITKYVYGANCIEIKKMDAVTNEFYLTSKADFNNHLQFTKFHRYRKNGNETVMKIVYTANGLLESILLDNNLAAKFTYVFY